MEQMEALDAALAVKRGQRKLADIPDKERALVRGLLRKTDMLANRARAEQLSARTGCDTSTYAKPMS